MAVIAHGLFHSTDGHPLPAWLADFVLVMVPLSALIVVLLLFEHRTRPRDIREDNQ